MTKIVTLANGYKFTIQITAEPAPAPPNPTVSVISTVDTTPTILGTAVVLADEVLTVTVNGVTYTAGDGDLVDNGDDTWSLTIPALNELPIGSYEVVASVTPTAGAVRTDTSSSEVSIVAGGGGSTLPPCNYIPEGDGQDVDLNLSGVYMIENLEPDGPGSIFECPTDHYAVAVHGLRGRIKIPASTKLTVPKRAFLLQSSDGVQVTGDLGIITNEPQLIVAASDIYMSDFSIRAGESTGLTASSHSSLDVLGINGDQVRNCAFVRMAMNGGDDNGTSCYGDVDGVSYIDCVVSHTPYYSQQQYPWFMQIGTNISVIRTYLEGRTRIPLLNNMGNVQYINCVSFSQIGPAITLTSGQTHSLMAANVEKCLIIRDGPTPSSIYMQHDTGVPGTLRIHLNDNVSIGQFDDPGSGVPLLHGAYSGTPDPAIYSGVPRHDMPVVDLLEHADLYAYILAKCGPLYNHRDPMNAQAFERLANREPQATLTRATNAGVAGAYGGAYPVMPPRSGTAVADIFDPSQPDKIKPEVKVGYGLPGDTNLLTSNITNGRLNDWCAVFDDQIGFKTLR